MNYNMNLTHRFGLVLVFDRGEFLRWTPHPVIVTIRDNWDYIRVLLFSYYTTITGWGDPPIFLLSKAFNTAAFISKQGKQSPACGESLEQVRV